MKCFHGNDAQFCPFSHPVGLGTCSHGDDPRYCQRTHDQQIEDFRFRQYERQSAEPAPSVLKQLIPYWPFG